MNSFTIGDAKDKYLQLCDLAGTQKTKTEYYHAVGIAHGYIKAVTDFFGPELATDIVRLAEGMNKTVLGIPNFNQQSIAHA